MKITLDQTIAVLRPGTEVARPALPISVPFPKFCAYNTSALHLVG